MTSEKILKGRGRTLDLSTPLIMGILNVTPDSFSDGGLYNSKDKALEQAERMVKEGAAVIDIGGESTRPGAETVSEDEELSRVLPVVQAVAAELDVFISVDTSSPTVMKACAEAGAHMWNDIRALQRNGAVELAAELDLAVCLMHMQGEPKTMQLNPHYENAVREVNSFLLDRAAVCEKAGIGRDHIMLDPGFGFGKSVDENYDLLASLPLFKNNGYALLSALSRKSMIGAVTGCSDPKKRVTGSAAGALISFMQGADMVRVHDVKETYETLCVYRAYAAAAKRCSLF